MYAHLPREPKAQLARSHRPGCFDIHQILVQEFRYRRSIYAWIVSSKTFSMLKENPSQNLWFSF